MTPGLSALNALPPREAAVELQRCCGASRWALAMAARRPYAGADALLAAAGEEWARMEREDLLEAFSHHPQIGDVGSLREKFAATAAWASGEQGGTAGAGEEVLQGLAQGNRDYLARFGHIFIVCATGKSAAEMLALLRARLPNPPDEELRIAAAEQEKITRLRLERLLAARGAP